MVSIHLHYGNWWRRGRCCTATLGRAWKRGSGAPSSGTSTSLISWPRRRSGSYESTRPGMYQLPPSTPLPPRPLWPPPPWPLPWPLHSLPQCVPCSRTLQRLQFLCTSHRTSCLLIFPIPLMFLLEVNGPESDVVPIYPHHLQGEQGCAVEVAPTFWLTKVTIFLLWFLWDDIFHVKWHICVTYIFRPFSCKSDSSIKGLNMNMYNTFSLIHAFLFTFELSTDSSIGDLVTHSLTHLLFFSCPQTA